MTGRLALRGWVVDRDTPSEQFRVAAFCGGKRIGESTVPRRRRPDVAQALGREDLTKTRIGFTILPEQLPVCRDDAMLFVVAFDQKGRAAVLAGTQKMPVIPAIAPE